MTSNLGADTKSTIGFSSTNSQKNNQDTINEFLSPELRARIDCKIDFNPLSKEIIQNITNKFLDQLSSKLTQQNKTIVMTKKALDEINSKAFSTKLGARYISQIIDNTIKQKLAYELLFGAFKINNKAMIDFQEDFVYEFIESEKSNVIINSSTIYFYTAQEAQQYAKENPGITITRALNGDGFMIKNQQYR